MSKPTVELIGKPSRLKDVPYGSMLILHDTHLLIKCRPLWRNSTDDIISPILGSIHMADKFHRFTPAQILIDNEPVSWKYTEDTPIKDYSGLFLSIDKLSGGDLFVLEEQRGTYGEKQIYIKLEDRNMAVGLLNGLVIAPRADLGLLKVNLDWSFNDIV